MFSDKYIPAMGNPYAKLMVIAEAPSFKEEEAGRPLDGPSGQ
jgi:uracil-DNA glycosylase